MRPTTNGRSPGRTRRPRSAWRHTRAATGVVRSACCTHCSRTAVRAPLPLSRTLCSCSRGRHLHQARPAHLVADGAARRVDEHDAAAAGSVRADAVRGRRRHVPRGHGRVDRGAVLRVRPRADRRREPGAGAPGRGPGDGEGGRGQGTPGTPTHGKAWADEGMCSCNTRTWRSSRRWTCVSSR
jgi:hypothetical protein